MKAIVYYYRGSLEQVSNRHRNGRAIMVAGFSECGINGGAIYPWMSRRACQMDAKRRGSKAVFRKIDGSPCDYV